MNNDYLEGMTTIQQRNVTSIYEPQNPLYHKEKDAYFYPLTSEKQIVMDDGRRLNAVLEEDFAKKDEVNSAKTEAIDSSKVYTNEQIKKAAPRNLLDNSDFRNPVNQRGHASGSAGANDYCIDRWELQYNTTITMMDGFIRLGGQYNFWQYIPTTLKEGKKYTCAAKVKASSGTRLLYFYVRDDNGNAISSANGKLLKEDWQICTMTFTAQTDIEKAMVEFHQSNDTIETCTDIEWVALYEGEYTAETLPEYQPKGYGAELLECQRYLQRFRTVDLRKTYCDDFRPTMRETAEGIVSTFDQEINGVTFYFASAEL